MQLMGVLEPIRFTKTLTCKQQNRERRLAPSRTDHAHRQWAQSIRSSATHKHPAPHGAALALGSCRSDRALLRHLLSSPHDCWSLSVSSTRATVSANAEGRRPNARSTMRASPQRLEEMLRDTDNLVHRRKKAPANEINLQAIMHDYLKACFPSFVSNPQIGGSIKNFSRTAA